ncbi:MAG TPA: hypothetical protein VLF60_03595 [Candidatus Saccharimonadales bacterium]|nr:hypothetical protein [Candidatus Saccharimonadales bacterium]
MAIVTKKEFRHFFRDRAAVFLLLGCALLALINIFNVILKVRVSDLQVPVRYSEYGFTLDRGHWTVLYELALFSALIFGLNGILAVKVRGLRRTYALGILALTLFVLIVAFLVTNALLGLLAA